MKISRINDIVKLGIFPCMYALCPCYNASVDISVNVSVSDVQGQPGMWGVVVPSGRSIVQSAVALAKSTSSPIES